MGTDVFPDAAVRVYLDASPEVRMERRARQLEGQGEEVDRDRLLDEIKARDAADSSRTFSPLRRVPEQTYLDSSDLDIEEVLDRLLAIAREGSHGDEASEHSGRVERVWATRFASSHGESSKERPGRFWISVRKQTGHVPTSPLSIGFQMRNEKVKKHAPYRRRRSTRCSPSSWRADDR